MAKLMQGSIRKLSESLSICECTKDTERPQGFWIYDTIAGHNLAMGNPDRDLAFTECITYYQQKLTKTQNELTELQNKVNAFVNQFVENDKE